MAQASPTQETMCLHSYIENFPVLGRTIRVIIGSNKGSDYPRLHAYIHIAMSHQNQSSLLKSILL